MESPFRSCFESAFAAAAQLPEAEQVALARALLAELASEAAIDGAIAAAPDALSRLAAEAIGEHRRGQTQPLDLERL